MASAPVPMSHPATAIKNSDGTYTVRIQHTVGGTITEVDFKNPYFAEVLAKGYAATLNGAATLDTAIGDAVDDAKEAYPDAKADVERLLATAKSQAQTILSDAQKDATALLDEADAEVKKLKAMPEPFGKMVYLASPYTHPDKQVQADRFLTVVKACGWLMVNATQVQMIYSPIVHTHPIADACTLPGHWQFWETCDKALLSRCNEIWVFCIPGWTKSTGVKAERKIASDYGLATRFVVAQPDGTYSITDTEPEGE